MNKRILTVAVAALALAACSKNETVEVAGNRAIEFENFVGNATRTVIDNNTLEKFYVFGGYSDVTDVFDNTQVTKDGKTGVLWTANEYSFAAYSNGNAKLESSVVAHTFEGNVLKFTGYEADEKTDLIAAKGTGRWDGTGEPQAVALNFKHLLSKIKFTFTTDAVEHYEVKVSGIKIANAITKGDATYNENGTTTWTANGSTGTYEFDDIADIALSDPNEPYSSEEYFVIPQSNAALEVEFTVTVSSSDADFVPLTNTFKGKLAVTTEQETDMWVSGYAYNYTAQINLEDVDGTVKYIKFTPSVGKWTDNNNGTATDINPTEVQP